LSKRVTLNAYSQIRCQNLVTIFLQPETG